MATLFISDLHLDASRPEVNALFLDFLRARATQSEALYILGDLFEVWLGDDAVHPAYEPMLEGLRRLTAAGTPVHIMRGNRDFLMGHGFEAQTGCTLLSDPTVIDLYGEPTLLMHGDTLCTDDLEYQRFRSQVRDPQTQLDFLALPLAQRIEVAGRYRAMSQEQNRLKSQEIMDVNPEAVTDAMIRHGVHRLIHGHTHRPAIHAFSIGGVPAQRIVLSDWYEQGSVLVCEATGCRLESLRFIAI